MSGLRLALRSLRHSPAFTLVALATLAVGIGVNAAMFSVLDALLFRAAPFPAADRIVQVIGQTRSTELRLFSAIELEEIVSQVRSTAALAIVGRTSFALAEPGQPAERVAGAHVSPDFFATFGLQPLLGRTFTPAEHQPGANQVILLSHAYWMSRYGGDPGVLGRTLRLEGVPCTIVGVMPPEMDYRRLWGHTVLWRPLNYTPDQQTWRDYRVFELFARLTSLDAPARFAAELQPLAAQQESIHPESYASLRYRVLPLHEALTDGTSRSMTWMLLGLSGFVLLIGCANLANLQLARISARSRESAVRAALGASRFQLLRQQLTESLLLGLGGGCLGLALGFGLNHLIAPYLVGSGLRVQLNLNVLLLTLLASLLTVLLFGVLPGLLGARVDLVSALKQQARGATAGRSVKWLRQGLIILQVALALTLLGGSAVLQQGFARLFDESPGWDVDRIAVATLPVSESRISTDEDRAKLYRRLRERLEELPGVQSVAITTSSPVLGWSGLRTVLIDGQAPGDPSLPSAFHVMTQTELFPTLGVPLLEGTWFSSDVKPTDPRVIVINESLARRLWPLASAVGRRIGSMDSGRAYWAEVIGVVRDIRTIGGTHGPATPHLVFKPLEHETWSYVNLVVRAAAPAAILDPMRRAVSEVDPDLAIAQMGTARELAEGTRHTARLAGRLLNGFAMLGLLLAATGLYGVINYIMVQRTNELGLRLALGAQPGQVIGLVVRHGLILTLLGLLVGGAGAWALGQALHAVMPRLAVPSAPPILGAVAVLFLIATFACWWPARRVGRIDPLEALRAE